MQRHSLLRLATAGSVDDGKSTLVGRLLHDSKSVLSDQLASVERVSRDRGLGQVDLALLTDGLRAEREQGITIDVAYRYFATARRSFILADCPGHVQYTRNTVTGASTADLVLVLVDVRSGVMEQTRRHLAVAALLRAPHVVLAVNKVDLVDYAEEPFRRVARQVDDVAAELGLADVLAVPVSALVGDNVVDRSPRTPWYAGPTLLEHLETVPLADEPQDEPFRFPVQYVLRPQQAAREPGLVDYRGYAGLIASGVVQVGDEVVVLPSGRRSTVVGIDTADGPLQVAFSPQSVSLRLADDLDVSRGDLLSQVAGAPQPTQDVEATVCWLHERSLRPRDRVLVTHGTSTVKAMVASIDGRLDLDTLAVEPCTQLTLNDIGRVRLRLASPLPVEPYTRGLRRTGAFLVVDEQDGWTLAAGMAGDPIRDAREHAATAVPVPG